MILLACDHGGLELKDALKAFIQERGLEVDDLGTMNGDSFDYPDYAQKVAQAIARKEAEQGILICGTGIGMSIAANKFPGVRAALAHDELTARMSREHNNANVLVLGGRVLATEEALKMVRVWLETPFEGARHQRRLDKISQIEDAVRQGRF